MKVSAIVRKKRFFSVFRDQDSGSALCHPFVHGGMFINSSNSFTWISQHFHYKKAWQRKNKYSSHRTCLNYSTSIDLNRNETKRRTFRGILNTDPSHPVMKNSRAGMVAASSVMIILFLERLTTSFIFAYLGFIYIDDLLRFWSLNTWIVNSRDVSNKIWGLVYNVNWFALWT